MKRVKKKYLLLLSLFISVPRKTSSLSRYSYTSFNSAPVSEKKNSNFLKICAKLHFTLIFVILFFQTTILCIKFKKNTKYSISCKMSWTDEKVEKLKELWSKGHQQLKNHQ